MQLLKNFLFTELKAFLFFLFLPFGVALGVLMLVWNVFDMHPSAEDSEEYVNKLKWDADFIAACITRPFQTALRGIGEFISDAFINPGASECRQKKKQRLTIDI